MGYIGYLMPICTAWTSKGSALNQLVEGSCPSWVIIYLISWFIRSLGPHPSFFNQLVFNSFGVNPQ
jgi:hypothetical protein